MSQPFLTAALDDPGPGAALAVPIVRRSGLLHEPNLYFDVLEPLAGAWKPPVVLVHGGAHTGACYLVTADGRPGWAPVLAERGHAVYVPDWPGTGRSGTLSAEAMDGMRVCAGLGNLLTHLDRPAILITHSMSGPYGWKLVETHGERIARLVAVAGGPPGNIQPVAEILAREGDTIEVRLEVPVRFDLRRPFVPPAAWARAKLVGDGTQFPREREGEYLAGLCPVPARLLYERFNVAGSQLRIGDFAPFRNKPILCVVGTNDADHPVDADRRTVEFLVGKGARARLLPLAERGILGNGHMMMLERNAARIARLIAEWLDAE